MPLPSGTRLGPHEITAPIGAGGMGEVYRATDTNLNRSVAIKVLPESVAGDADRLARFQREAELLAALNHPNIAAIYGLERSEGTIALVMELVEGPTLADRIAQGPIPVDEALGIARQIATALEAAHEQGIIHRDLKPANVKVRDDGTVKVLDFGLAKALEPVGADSSPEDSHSPTLTSPALSQVGVILGTAAYMSPEQARGKPVDRRADVWAFGAVLYEMLTGQRAFAGEDMTDTLAAVVRSEPSWEALPEALSPTLRAYLRRCLQKDPKQRIHDVADVRFALEGAFDEPPARPGSVSPGASPKRRLFLTSAVALAALVIGVLVDRTWLRAPGAGPAQGLTRFTVDLPPGQHLWGGHKTEEQSFGLQRPSRPAFALSPDGRELVFVASDGTTSRLFRRPMDRAEATPMPGTEGASVPVFSPEGNAVAFRVGAELKRVSMETGEVRTLTMSGSTQEFYGFSWTARDTLVLGSADGVYEVQATGGRVSRLTTGGSSQDDSIVWPQLLPGGRAVLFDAVTGGAPSQWNIVIESLDTGQRKVVIEGGSDPLYVPSGHILFVRTGTLMAVPFDLGGLEVTGPSIVVVEDVMHAEGAISGELLTGAGQFSVSRSGTLAHVPGGIYPVAPALLVWVDHTGVDEALPLPTDTYIHPRFAPEGRRLVYVRGTAGDYQIWVYDIELKTPVRVTTTGTNQAPVWSPDGMRLVFASETEGRSQLFWMPSDGSGKAQRVTEGDAARGSLPASWSSEGTLAFLRDGDIWTVQMEGDGVPIPFLETPSQEGWPAFSPDGRWLAYASNETGRFEVYVRPFPGREPVHRVSTAGGASPLWSPSGKRLFYWGLRNGHPDGEMMVLDVTTGTNFARGAPRELFDSPLLLDSSPVRSYDIAPDGRRFVMLKMSELEPQPVTRIHVDLNWLEELNERVPVD